MNVVVSFPLKAASWFFQLILAIAAVVFLFIDFNTTAICTGILGFYQVVSAVYIRSMGRIELSHLREAWETVAGAAGIFIATFAFSAFIYALIDGKGDDFLLGLLGIFIGAVFVALPLIMRVKARHQCMPWFAAIGTLLFLPLLSSIFYSEFFHQALEVTTGGLFVAFTLMLFVGPILAITYLVGEGFELNQAMKVNNHSPIDL